MNYALAIFQTKENFKFQDIEKFRGFIGNLFRDKNIFHNHIDDKSVAYTFPKIQYRLVKNKLAMLGLNEGVGELVKHVGEIKEINIDGSLFKVEKIDFELKDESIYVSDEFYKYEFISPWLALNKKNFENYINDEIDFDRIMIGNMITVFKGLKVEADKQIIAKVFLDGKMSKMKDVLMKGFTGNFVSNVYIPDYIGFGKRSSIGRGVVKKIKNGH